MKSAKGTIDIGVDELRIRSNVENIIRNTYSQFGGLEYQTPLLEQTSFLQKKYGDDTKLIFDLEKKGAKEQCSLRYDLTVPFTRFCLKNSLNKGSYFQIGKVFRMDIPNLEKGRLREFTQCDFDIIGAPELDNIMLPETLLLFMATTIMKRLNLPNFVIKVNHRQALVDLLNKSGVSNNNLQNICSSIDKLDKCTWDDLIPELQTKGLSDEIITNIHNELQTVIPGKWFNTLSENAKYLDFADKIEYCPTLARGMDYYTGLIYEIVYNDSSIGTIISGGRYDNLTQSFRNVKLNMCGISIGLDRLMKLVQEPGTQEIVIDKRYLIYRISNEPSSLTCQFNQLLLIVKKGTKMEVEFNARSMSKHLKYAKKNNLIIVEF